MRRSSCCLLVSRIACCLCDTEVAALCPGLSNQAVPEDEQDQFQHTYTVLIAFLTVILPPVITQGVNDVPSTDQETALGTLESLCVLHGTVTCHASQFKVLLTP